MPVRPARPDDVDALCGLIHDLARYEHLEDQVALQPTDLSTWLFGPGAVASAAIAETDEGEVAGFALWFATFSTFLGRPGIWLEDLFVRPALRGQGHGWALLSHLRERTDGRLEWSVLDWNESAIAFYERVGARRLDGWTTYRWPPRG